VAKINEYVKHVNSGAGGSVLDGSRQPVTHGPATHAGAKPGMVQYTLNGRTYSTHADTTQLFPVSGTGIVSGQGAADMKRALEQLGELDVKTFYALDCLEHGRPQRAWAQTSKAVQREAETTFQLFMKS
jgi:hypothetical protein